METLLYTIIAIDIIIFGFLLGMLARIVFDKIRCYFLMKKIKEQDERIAKITRELQEAGIHLADIDYILDNENNIHQHEQHK